MTAGDCSGTGLPPALAARPRDPRSGLPVPYVNVATPDGCDFTRVDTERSLRCARERLCSLCGTPMDGEVAFIGGQECREQGRYLDPPMHPDCGEAAMGTCPYLSEPYARQAAGGPDVPQGWAESGTGQFTLHVTASYEWELAPAEARPCPVFRPGPPTTV
jgi:hypothetical protein